MAFSRILDDQAGEEPIPNNSFGFFLRGGLHTAVGLGEGVANGPPVNLLLRFDRDLRDHGIIAYFIGVGFATRFGRQLIGWHEVSRRGFVVDGTGVGRDLVERVR